MSTAEAIASRVSFCPDAVVMSNQASQVSRVAVMNAVITTACRRRQASQAVAASAASRMVSKPTQVSLQCPAT